MDFRKMRRIFRERLILLKKGQSNLRHSHSAAVRAYPGGTVADAPLVFLKAGIADLKTARAVPAELLFFLTAMAFELFLPPTALRI